MLVSSLESCNRYGSFVSLPYNRSWHSVGLHRILQCNSLIRLRSDQITSPIVPSETVLSTFFFTYFTHVVASCGYILNLRAPCCMGKLLITCTCVCEKLMSQYLTRDHILCIYDTHESLKKKKKHLYLLVRMELQDIRR